VPEPPHDPNSCDGDRVRADEQCREVWHTDPTLPVIMMAERVFYELGKLVTHLGGVTMLTGFGARPKPGERYAILDHHGYVGMVIATDREHPPDSCWDACPHFWVVAEWTDGPRMATGSQPIAVGPLRNPVPRATLRHAELADPVDGARGWQSLLTIDLDGDRVPDLEVRSRDCACDYVATETRTFRSGETIVTERLVQIPLP
jgi:hypothetical protein